MSSLKRKLANFQADPLQDPAFAAAFKRVKKNSDLNLKVYIRFVSPSKENYTDLYQFNVLENSITVKQSEEEIVKNGGISKFLFTKIFSPITTQQEINKTLCFPLIEDLFTSSKSGIILTYGGINSGYASSVIGTKKDLGIILWICRVIMSKSKEFRDQNKKLEGPEETTRISLKPFIEIFEINGEETYDLLSEIKKQMSAVSVRRPKKEQSRVSEEVPSHKDFASMELISWSQVERVLEKCRSQYATRNSNNQSQLVYRIKLKHITENLTEKFTRECSLCIVDLSGSERVKSTEVDNRVLGLEECFKIIKAKQDSENVMADSKLGNLINDYCQKDMNIRVIAHINSSPLQTDTDETMRVFNCIALSKCVQLRINMKESIRRLVNGNKDKPPKEKRTEDLPPSVGDTLEWTLRKKPGRFLSCEEETMPSEDSQISIGTTKIEEKDLKIELLEGMAMKLQEKLSYNNTVNKLTTFNNKLKTAAKAFTDNENNCLSRILQPIPESLNIFGISIVQEASPNKSSNTPEFLKLEGIQPVNVNYFVFQGPVEERCLNNILDVFSVKSESILAHNSLINSHIKIEDQKPIEAVVNKSTIPKSNIVKQEIKETPLSANNNHNKTQTKNNQQNKDNVTRVKPKKIKKAKDMEKENIFRVINKIAENRLENSARVKEKAFQNPKDCKEAKNKENKEQEVKKLSVQSKPRIGNSPIATRTRGASKKRE